MIPIQLRINTREIYTCEFAPDGSRAITGAQKNLVQIWDVATGWSVRGFAHPGSV
jgi:WD40 repeat protein